MIYYSGTTNGFYDENNHDIPVDAVEISDEAHQQLLEGQSFGKAIVPNADGYPVLADPPEPSLAERQQAATDQRRAAYQRRADPLYFMYIRNETGYTEQRWKDEIELIRQEIPYPEA